MMSKAYWLLWRLWHAPFYVLPDAWRGWRNGYGFWHMVYLRWIGLAYWADIFRDDGKRGWK